MSGRVRLLAALAGLTILVAGCGPLGERLAGATATPSPLPPSPTPPPPPLAAYVNGEAILLSTFEQELARFEAAQAELGIELATEQDRASQVLQALVDRTLLAQAARAAGLQPGEQDIERELDALAAELGSNEAVGAWLAASGYSIEEFQQALAEEMTAARMVARITSGVPTSAEQVHARHILLAGREEAEQVLAQVLSGEDFATLAVARSLDLSTRPAGGDLGWFPRGVLTVPEVEQASFALQPGETSGVIESDLGYHVIQCLERGERAMSPEAMRRLQEQAVLDWLSAARAAARIEVLFDVGGTGE